MTAFLFVLAAMVGAAVLAIAFGDGLYRSRRRRELPPVVDLGVHRRRRNGSALAGVTVDMSLVDADRTRRERYVLEGGCADYWIGDVSRCRHDGCACGGRP